MHLLRASKAATGGLRAHGALPAIAAAAGAAPRPFFAAAGGGQRGEREAEAHQRRRTWRGPPATA